MIGSIIGGLIGKGGADSAASGISGAASQAGNQAFNTANAQLKRNYSALSPYMSAGQGALGIIGQLLGLGTLTGGEDGASFQADPNSVKSGSTQIKNYINALGGKPMTEVTDKYTEDPGYGFRLTEGMRALDRTAASKGKLLSGQQFKAAQDFNSGLASQEYNDWFKRLQSQNSFNWGMTRDALGDYFNVAGQGGNAANALTGANTGLMTNASSIASNALMNGAVASGQATMAGANALASGIGSGINNMLTGAYMGFGGSNPIFGGRKSSYSGSGTQY